MTHYQTLIVFNLDEMEASYVKRECKMYLKWLIGGMLNLETKNFEVG